MKGLLFILLACLAWSVDTLIRYPLLFKGVSAVNIVFAEHFILTLIFLPNFINSFKRVLSSKIVNILYFIIIGSFGSALATLSFTKAFFYINPSLVILLQKLQPLVAIIFAWLILGEKVSRKFLLWGGASLIGVLLICWPDIETVFTSNVLFKYHDKLLYGYGLTLFSVLFWGVSTVFGKKLSNAKLRDLDIMGGRFFFGFIALIPFALAQREHFQLGLEINLKILLMVAMSGLIGMFFYYRGLRLMPARVAAVAELFFPLSAVTVNWIFLGKELLPLQMLGGAILIFSSTIIRWRKY